MEIRVLEIRDEGGTFMPVVCIRPVAENEGQRYLLRRDGYRADETEHCIIVIKPQCRGVAYDPYDWDPGTMQQAHHHIEQNWASLKDGDVVDVEFITGQTPRAKSSERVEYSHVRCQSESGGCLQWDVCTRLPDCAIALGVTRGK